MIVKALSPLSLSLATIRLATSALHARNANAATQNEISYTSNSTLSSAWHPNYGSEWSEGHCHYIIDPNTVGHTSELACCNASYRGQRSGYCLSRLQSLTALSLTGSDGFDVWYPDYDTEYSDAYCINSHSSPSEGSRPIYTSMMACCRAAYAGQMSGKCLSMLPEPPTTSPTDAGGLNVWYADYSTNNYSDGRCINERPLPNGLATYDTQLECCNAAYGSQISGKCLSSLPNPPTVSPTASGRLDVYYPDYSKPFSNGVCSSAHPIPYGIAMYTSQEVCCSSVYGSQSSLSCICDLPNPPTVCLARIAKAELAAAECLYQRDFSDGMVIISKSGSYKLCEDIVFAPDKPNLRTSSDEDIANSFDPARVVGGDYNKKEFSLGFFAAMCIAANDVTLLLNGYTIQQGPSHALMQRFFAVIELATSPFIAKVGPADFVSDAFIPATNFVLKGPGMIGLSSHHGIHGNNNENVTISDVTFQDFEVAAVSLNNVKGLSIENCNIPHNRLDVPIIGSFSAARQILPYIKALKETVQPYSMQLRGSATSSADVYASLVTSIANVYKDVMTTGFIDQNTHPEEHNLFDNIHRAVDGPCYAFLVHGKGPAVGGQGFELSADANAISSNVSITKNHIEQMKCWTNEIPSVVIDNVVQNDARGGMVQLINTVTNEWLASDSHSYVGNILTDAQIMVASAIHDGTLDSNDINLQTGANTIAPQMVAWAANPSVTLVPSFRCNGDSMHHVVKGSIMIRVEDTQGFIISDNTIGKALVESVSGVAAGTEEYFSKFPGTQVKWTCDNYHKGASIEDGSEQQLANIRGISVAAVSRFLDSSKSMISGNIITNFKSENANAIVGIDVQGVSEGIKISGNYVNLKEGVGTDPDDQYIACRIRKYSSQGDIVKANNELFQEEFIEQIPDRKLRWRKIPDSHPPVTTEWDYGGCPFG